MNTIDKATKGELADIADLVQADPIGINKYRVIKNPHIEEPKINPIYGGTLEEKQDHMMLMVTNLAGRIMDRFKQVEDRLDIMLKTIDEVHDKMIDVGIEIEKNDMTYGNLEYEHKLLKGHISKILSMFSINTDRVIEKSPADAILERVRQELDNEPRERLTTERVTTAHALRRRDDVDAAENNTFNGNRNVEGEHLQPINPFNVEGDSGVWLNNNSITPIEQGRIGTTETTYI